MKDHLTIFINSFKHSIGLPLWKLDIHSGELWVEPSHDAAVSFRSITSKYQNDAVINQTIISDKNDMPLYESLQFDLYARYDHYSAFLSIIISKI